MKPIEKFKLIESIKAIMEKERYTRREVAFLSGLSIQKIGLYINGVSLPTGARLNGLIGFVALTPMERAYRLSHNNLAAPPNFGEGLSNESVESSTHQLLQELIARVEKLEGLTLKTSFFGKTLTKQG